MDKLIIMFKGWNTYPYLKCSTCSKPIMYTTRDYYLRQV